MEHLRYNSLVFFEILDLVLLIVSIVVPGTLYLLYLLCTYSGRLGNTIKTFLDKVVLVTVKYLSVIYYEMGIIYVYVVL